MITHQKILRVNKNNRENTDPKIKIDDPVKSNRMGQEETQKENPQEKP